MQTGQADVGTPRAIARSGGKREALCTVRGKTQSTVRRVASDAGVCKKSCSCVVHINCSLDSRFPTSTPLNNSTELPVGLIIVVAISQLGIADFVLGGDRVAHLERVLI